MREKLIAGCMLLMLPLSKARGPLECSEEVTTIDYIAMGLLTVALIMSAVVFVDWAFDKLVAAAERRRNA